MQCKMSLIIQLTTDFGHQPKCRLEFTRLHELAHLEKTRSPTAVIISDHYLVSTEEIILNRKNPYPKLYPIERFREIPTCPKL